VPTAASLISPDSFSWAGVERHRLGKLLPSALQTADSRALFCRCLRPRCSQGFARGGRRGGGCPSWLTALEFLPIAPRAPWETFGKSKATFVIWMLPCCLRPGCRDTFHPLKTPSTVTRVHVGKKGSLLSAPLLQEAGLSCGARGSFLRAEKLSGCPLWQPGPSPCRKPQDRSVQTDMDLPPSLLTLVYSFG